MLCIFVRNWKARAHTNETATNVEGVLIAKPNQNQNKMPNILHPHAAHVLCCCKTNPIQSINISNFDPVLLPSTYLFAPFYCSFTVAVAAAAFFFDRLFCIASKHLLLSKFFSNKKKLNRTKVKWVRQMNWMLRLLYDFIAACLWSALHDSMLPGLIACTFLS